MARKNTHSEDEVLLSLRKKRDVKIDPVQKIIQVINGFGKTKPNNDLGNGSWGKIDFLKNYCGYKQYLVAEFSIQQPKNY